jgi:hypothetical protein
MKAEIFHRWLRAGKERGSGWCYCDGKIELRQQYSLLIDV